MSVVNNKASRNGGGIYIENHSNKKFNDVSVLGSTAYYWGGGICMYKGPLYTYLQ